MSRTLLLIGTRKGLFLLESDADRRDWTSAGRSARAGPSTTPCYDAESGAIYAAAASEWHGSAVWRSDDLGETWALSSEGLTYDETGERKVSKVSSLAVTDGKRARRRRGARHLREHRRRRELVAADDARGPARQRGVGRPGQPAARPSRHLDADPGRRRRARTSGRSCRASACSRRTTAARPGRRATRACAPTGRGRTRRSASASTAWCARPSTRAGCTSRTTSACTAPTTAATRGRRSPRACRASSASPRPRTRTTGTAST